MDRGDAKATCTCLNRSDRFTRPRRTRTNPKNQYNVRVAAQQSLEQQYQTLVAGPAWIDRSCRALIEVTGKDRVVWAHNLTTNQVKTLTPGEGNYAFVLNVQGRILFDLNLIVRPDSILMDLDRRFLPTALKHFQKYIIMEDVSLADRSGDFTRVALAGERAKQLCSRMGASNAAAMASISSSVLHWNSASFDFFRSDFCGVFAVDVFVPSHDAGSFHAVELGATPVNDEAVQVRRIEAGIPWPGAEITEEALPAETRQLERAVSFQKGCYLGQEIVERMRARKVAARLLSGLRVEGDAVPPQGAEILAQDAVVGKVTSACRSIFLGQVIALGYVKAGAAPAGAALTLRWDGHSTNATITGLPFVSVA